MERDSNSHTNEHTKLVAYVVAGNLTGLQQEMLASGETVNVNELVKDGLALLHLAVINGHLSIVKFLVDELKCDIEVKATPTGFTALRCALGYQGKQWPFIVQYLLKRGAKSDERTLGHRGYAKLAELQFKPESRKGQSLPEASSVKVFDASSIEQEAEEFGTTMRNMGFCLLRYDREGDAKIMENFFAFSKTFFESSEAEKFSIKDPEGRIHIEKVQDILHAPTGKYILSYKDKSTPSEKETALGAESGKVLKDVYAMMGENAKASLRALSQYATSEPTHFDYLIQPDHLSSNLQSFYYLPGEAPISCGTHYDMNILTTVLFDFKINGLQALCPESYLFNWWPVEQLASPKFHNAHAVVFPAATLHRATGGFYPALLHRVLASKEFMRNSTVFKLKSPDTVKIDSEKFVDLTLKKHNLDDASWLAPPTQSMWKNTGLSKEKQQGHPFLGMSLDVAAFAPKVTYAEFSKALGEWFNHKDRFVEPNRLLDSVEIKTAFLATLDQKTPQPTCVTPGVMSEILQNILECPVLNEDYHKTDNLNKEMIIQ